MNKAFKKEDLVKLVFDGEASGLAVAEDRLTGHSRWSLHHRLVFKELVTDTCYCIGYSTGATEQQHESPFQDEDDLIECEQVSPVVHAVTVYESSRDIPPDKERGIYQKYSVQRVDGSSLPGGKHEGCDYFVLDLTHDAHARAAILAYARSCKLTHPKLSEELTKKANQGVKFHLYEDDEGHVYAAHTVREAREAWMEDTGWTPELEGWWALPDEQGYTDSKGKTKTYAEYAEEYRQNNLKAGCIGGPE